MSVAFNYREIAGDDPTKSVPSAETSTNSVAGAARFDVCPTWLELAIRHLSDAGAAQVSRAAEGRDTHGIAEMGMLEWEFEASLQAIVACGIAVHAFGAAIQSNVQLPQSVSDEWQRQGTPRYIQISEVLRRAFELNAKNTSGVRQCLGEILRFHGCRGPGRPRRLHSPSEIWNEGSQRLRLDVRRLHFGHAGALVALERD